MEILQTIVIHALIVILLAPLLLCYGLPFIGAAVLFHRYTTAWLGERMRFTVACGIAALGIAPSFDMYRGPTAIWLRWWNGETVGALAALLSFALTWLIVQLQLKTLAHRRHAAA